MCVCAAGVCSVCSEINLIFVFVRFVCVCVSAVRYLWVFQVCIMYAVKCVCACVVCSEVCVCVPGVCTLCRKVCVGL